MTMRTLVDRPVDRQREPSAGEVIAEAIRTRQTILARHHGHFLVFCPHALAHHPDGAHVLAFLLRAELPLVAEKLSSPRRWRWLRVDDLAGMMAVLGSWRTGPPGSRPALPGARIELEVQEVDAGGRAAGASSSKANAGG
jgi:hypothetical protein